MTALAERKVDEMDALTVAVATAGSLLLSPDALKAWQSQHGGSSAPDAPMSAQTLGIVMRQFPGALRVS